MTTREEIYNLSLITHRPLTPQEKYYIEVQEANDKQPIRLHKPNEVKTSITHPINLSWIIPPKIHRYWSVANFPDNHFLFDMWNYSTKELLSKLTTEQQLLFESSDLKLKGNICMSSCPGKKVRLSGPVRGRATINRDLNLDFARMKSFNIGTIVCCLDDRELQALGAPWPEYKAAADTQNLNIIRLPMIEGRSPDTLKEVREAINKVNIELLKGDNVLVHCRGGVGRAGVFVGCWILENNLLYTAEHVVDLLRMRRSSRAIETVNQVEYLVKYAKSVDLRLNRFSRTFGLEQSEFNLYTTDGVPTIQHVRSIERSIEHDLKLANDQFLYK